MTTPCWICGLEGGFHDTDNKAGKHVQHEVPREVLKETGWHKLAHEELLRERAERDEMAALIAMQSFDAHERAEEAEHQNAEVVGWVGLDGDIVIDPNWLPTGMKKGQKTL